MKTCPTCGASKGWRYRAYATFLLSRIRSGRSYGCESCGLQMEACGRDHVELDLHAEVLALEGVWGVRNANPRNVAKVVAELLNRRVVELWPHVKDSTTIAIGLKAEANWVAEKLALLGEKPELVAVDEVDGLFTLGARP